MEKRNTIQKSLISDAIENLHCHVTADEVYDYIKQTHPTIGKGTVYRNLNLMAEENIIRRVEIPNGPDKYDCNVTKHYHVRCIKCNKLFDVDMDEVKGIDEQIHDKHGVLFLDYDILFKGICPDCQKNQEEE